MAGVALKTELSGLRGLVCAWRGPRGEQGPVASLSKPTFPAPPVPCPPPQSPGAQTSDGVGLLSQGQEREGECRAGAACHFPVALRSWSQVLVSALLFTTLKETPAWDHRRGPRLS